MIRETALIEANNLSVAVPRSSRWFPSRKPDLDILVDVSVAIKPGEIVCMVGESGSGKTTFGRALLGLVRPSAGQIVFDGTPLPDFSPASFKRIRREASLLFQDPVTSFDPRQRIGSILAEPRRIARSGSVARSEIEELARKAGLASPLLSKFPHALSGGQARRAAVARALSVVPRLIVADEPTAGLDVSVQGGVLNLFLDIREEFRTSFLIITHNLSIARHVSDRIVILYLGRVLESGPAREIFRAPRHPYTRALLDCEPIPNPAKRREAPPVIGEVPGLAARPSGCEFHTRCAFAQDRCRHERPLQTTISAEHEVACHYPLTPRLTVVGPPPQRLPKTANR
ncbi:ABC transporter ATP-binding protein [Phyllobacterium sp. SYP-B3895]|uniref:ABC transporter ATP-binding protein n=1 Tax=Phyllobacterium sp. SYP-B3895 TaxID=2663240 RepID=UPI0015629635|nr:ABC transporter ATP-binding protein [Phyllobacterium sp. SYP-B3895]